MNPLPGLTREQPLRHSQGNDKARVTLLEYGDFECVHCGKAFAIIKELQAAFDGNLRFVFRHFPLRSLHPNAERAAEASEAAAEQGRFWEMHELLFQNQKSLQDADLHRYAQRLKLDLGLFDDSLRSGHLAKRISADFQKGAHDGIDSTPGLLINGKKYDGPLELAPLRDAIQRELDEELIRLAI